MATIGFNALVLRSPPRGMQPERGVARFWGVRLFLFARAHGPTWCFGPLGEALDEDAMSVSAPPTRSKRCDYHNIVVVKQSVKQHIRKTRSTCTVNISKEYGQKNILPEVRSNYQKSRGRYSGEWPIMSKEVRQYHAGPRYRVSPSA
ncbi:hypothetical protein NDU88_007097 [Pleurodeles waltl]|uniref:Uncharacterized protein n=1 Tax=Pleurodeles waltl TaxID=8319 RepID=A0AAV7P185_PLEWA|nr:hypothetical protein NDU88_007097 [Pleurodeles waltl]